ncbi:MAG TPA: metallophosphoesterase [Sedimentisphaerales bacterium]|nr:metallophosphoesterase [Sedimentisphaerales bacterium]
MSQVVIDLLNKGAEASASDLYRHGNLVRLPGQGSIIITGDIHGHRRNLERVISYANLDENPDRHVVLQEIIHGGETDRHGGCLSFEILFEAVSFKVRYPDQVHIIMGNHDTAFMTESEVMKDGREMNYLMRTAMKKRYGDLMQKTDLAIRRYLFSQPLAVKCDNGIWISHSLPDNRTIKAFNPEVFETELRMDDIARGGAAHSLLWGRNQSHAAVDAMAQLVGATVFVTGHQPQECGWNLMHPNMLILSSEHNHGVLLCADLGRSYTGRELSEMVMPLAAIA